MLVGLEEFLQFVLGPGNCLQIHFVPFLRCPLALVSHYPFVADCPLTDDIQNDFGIDIPAGGTGTGSGIRIFGSPLEICDGLNGIAVIYRISSFVEYPQPVEKLEDIGRRLNSPESIMSFIKKTG